MSSARVHPEAEGAARLPPIVGGATQLPPVELPNCRLPPISAEALSPEREAAAKAADADVLKQRENLSSRSLDSSPEHAIPVEEDSNYTQFEKDLKEQTQHHEEMGGERPHEHPVQVTQSPSENSAGDPDKGPGGGMQPTQQQRRPLMTALCDRFGRILSTQVFLLIIYVMLQTVGFFFFRSTVSCEMQRDANGTVIVFDTTSKDWSGSELCNDKCKVANQAAYMDGLLKSIEHFIQLWTYPLMGAACDDIGRKPMMLVSVVGVLICMLLYTTASSLSQDGLHMDSVFAILALGNLIKGATEIHHVIPPAAVTDLAQHQDEIPMLISTTVGIQAIFQILAGAVTISVLSQNLTDYTPFWIVCSGMVFSNVIAVCTIFPETLEEAKRIPITMKNSLPFVTMMTLCRDGRHFFGIAIFCVIFVVNGIILVTVPFTIVTYGWSQATASTAMASFYVGVTIVVALLSTPAMDYFTEHGDTKVYMSSLWIIMAGFTSVCFASFSFIFLAIAIALWSLGAGLLIPSYKTILAKMEPPEKQGKLLSAMCCVVLAASLLSTLAFSALIREIGTGGDCSSGKGVYPGLAFLIMAAIWLGAAVCGTLWGRAQMANSKTSVVTPKILGATAAKVHDVGASSAAVEDVPLSPQSVSVPGSPAVSESPAPVITRSPSGVR